jgi:branched-chain amino acid transport system ATP-binding protein
MLKLSDVNSFYGKSHVLHNTSLEVKEKELVGLVGRNGVGKSTTLKSIMGLVPPKSGTVRFEDIPISSLPAYRIPRMGMAYVPQGRRLFPKLTVLENLKIPLVNKPLDSEKLEEVFAYFPRLKERLAQKAGTLSGGEQQMLALGRALIIYPKMILLDEPTEGLMPLLVQLISHTVQKINQKGIPILLVEQNVKNLKGICHRIYIMEKGAVVYEGTPAELDQSPEIQERYLSVKVG